MDDTFTDLGGWQLTGHALERCAERNVTVLELLYMLAAPQRRQPTDTPDREHCRIYVGYGIAAVVDPGTREVLTVLLDGETSSSWKQAAARRVRVVSDEQLAAFAAKVQTTRGVGTIRVDAEVGPQVVITRPTGGRKVDHREVLDRLHPGVRSQVARLLDCDGWERLTILTPTEVVIE